MTSSTLHRGQEKPAGELPTAGLLGGHPVGTGLGAVAGGVAAGALVGSMAGPVGTAVGAAIGAVTGGLAGKAIGDVIDTSAEEGYWREHFTSRPYVARDSSFEDYGPAYRFGVDSCSRLEGRSFDQVEPELKNEWERAKGASHLSWDRARDATRDAWQRVSDAIERAVPGDSDRDGK